MPSFAVWLGSRVIPTSLALALTISITERALAVDCLAYKPDRAQGEWHADVVSGKICWYGPNWRSFLPRPKVSGGKFPRYKENARYSVGGPQP